MKESGVYMLTVSAYSRWDAKHGDGRHAAQVWAMVMAKSRAAAARAFGVSSVHLRDYGGVTANIDAVYEAGRYPWGTVLIHGMDPGDTVFGGQEGWVPLSRPEEQTMDEYEYQEYGVVITSGPAKGALTTKENAQRLNSPPYEPLYRRVKRV